jgi:uncharacterized membrane protein
VQPPAARSQETIAVTIPEHISQNIDSIIEFYRREERKTSSSQRRLEHLGRLIGRPTYLLSVISIVIVWLLFNLLARSLGLRPFDPPPFSWLQGVLGLGAFLTTTVVLITQNRHALIETQRLNLNLQVNLLTEQKTTKLIHLLEELRRDLPMVRDRHDSVAGAMQAPTDPAQMLAALEVQREADRQSADPGAPGG